jgi:hypothetical protein
MRAAYGWGRNMQASGRCRYTTKRQGRDARRRRLHQWKKLSVDQARSVISSLPPVAGPALVRRPTFAIMSSGETHLNDHQYCSECIVGYAHRAAEARTCRPVDPVGVRLRGKIKMQDIPVKETPDRSGRVCYLAAAGCWPSPSICCSLITTMNTGETRVHGHESA